MSYALVTPARNEAKNVERLISSVLGQDEAPSIWIVVENGSTDDTFERFWRSSARIGISVPHFVLLRYQDEEAGYALGEKYSRVIQAGWSQLRQVEISTGRRMTFQGILDADSFPKPNYYRGLIEAFALDSTLGILSGQMFYEGPNGVVVPNQNSDWALGMCRLWRRECFDDAGYIVSVSADAVSAARALVRGWRVASIPALQFETREMGANVGQQYYGKSAYIRRLPLSYVVLGVIRLGLSEGWPKAARHWEGYWNAWRQRLPRLNDPLALKYFRHPYRWRLLGMLRKKRNQ